MKTSEITLIGQYIKDLSFENPMAPNLPSQNKNPTVNLDINTTYLDLKNNNHEINLKIKSTASIDKDTNICNRTSICWINKSYYKK